MNLNPPTEVISKWEKMAFFQSNGIPFSTLYRIKLTVSYNRITLDKPWEPIDSGCWGLNRISLLPKIFSFPISINTTSNKSFGILIPVFNGDINLHRIFFWCLTAAIPICWYPTEIGT